VTLVAGVAGQPIAHSLSPLIHGAWLAAAGLDAEYRAFGPADEAGFDALVAEGRRGALRGLNVTAPFKERALQLADTASATARRCGSANLLVFDEGRLTADSTDGAGLLAALAAQAPGLDLAGAHVVLLGAGGAARAAAAALTDAGAAVAVLNRTTARAEALAADLGVDVAAPGDLEAAALVVNALSVAPDLAFDRLRGDVVLMDMTYRPLQTDFLAQGRKRGLAGVDGLAMLIGQAQPSFRALFGMEPPAVDVRRLALEDLGETA
jgi:shikimate dehydrogenase